MTALAFDYLEGVRERLRKASPGPWTSFVEGRDHESGSSFIRTGAQDMELTGATPADQDFIAHARQDIPLLLAEIARLDALLAGVRTAAA